MKNLEEVLQKRILNFGPLSISEYMLEANLNPKFGYYNNNLPFGKNKDYITAPEVSQMFGEIIALWSIDCWKKMGEPKNFNIVELGPGTGVLIKDFIKTTKGHKKFIESCKKIYLLEISSYLKKKQKKNLANEDKKILNKITWIRNLDKILNTPFIIIANEFFDALPIKQIQFTEYGWRERLINFNNKKKNFFFSLSNNPTILEKFLPKKNGSKKKIGEIYEIPTQMINVINEIFQKIKKIKSACLIIDYAKKKKFGNSLKSIKKQKIINPLYKIGTSDLSCHIDFELIKNFSKNYNLVCHGPNNQRNFLLNLGILYRSKILIKNGNDKQKKMVKNSLDFLINEKKMGRIFNVISIRNKNVKNLIGFI